MVEMNLENCKVRISDEKENILVQKKLFELGYDWWKGNNKALQNLSAKYLFIDENRTISFMSSDDPYFIRHEYIEVSVKDILGHRSDCALHNEPAFQKGCSCHIIKDITFIGIKEAKLKEILEKVKTNHPDWIEEPKKTLAEKAESLPFLGSSFKTKDVFEALGDYRQDVWDLHKQRPSEAGFEIGERKLAEEHFGEELL